MTTRQHTRARRPTPDAAGEGDETTAGPRLDGRRAHVLDRAAEYVRLADQGLSAAQIARRRRKSAGHVSILLRLGRALATVPEDERAALRSPRVTWRLVQRLVRLDVDGASLRKQLRDAVGGFSTHNVDGRTRRRRRAPEQAVSVSTPGVGWGWDAAWFATDPVGYAAAHLAHLTHVHQVVAARASQAVRARATGDLAGIDTGQSLRGLQRRLRQAADPTIVGAVASDDERHALATFAALGRALSDAEAAVVALGAGVGGGSVGGGSAAARRAHDTISDDDLADDLEDE